jgi:hypothetical protein
MLERVLVFIPFNISVKWLANFILRLHFVILLNSSLCLFLGGSISTTKKL